MSKIYHILKEKTGNGVPLAAAVTISLLMLFLVIAQYIHLYVIAAGVKDAMQQAIISVVNDNYNEVYHAAREGYAAGYEPYDGGFQESLDAGDVYGQLGSLLGLVEHDSNYCKFTSDGKAEYRLHGLAISITHTALASGRTAFEATAQIQLEVPITFINKILPDMSIKLVTKAIYTPKF